MATSEGIPSSIDIEFLELNDNPYISPAITVIGVESSELMTAVSGWTYDGNKEHGFDVVEEDNTYDDDDF